jgi:hypothetical protein
MTFADDNVVVVVVAVVFRVPEQDHHIIPQNPTSQQEHSSFTKPH